MHDTNTFVILTPGFPASVADSTCLPMQQQFVKALKQYDPSLNIIVLSLQYPYHTEVYNWHDITVMSFNGRNKGGLRRLILRRKIYAALKKINDQSNITGILSFWYNECAWIGNKFAAKNRLNHFCWILGQDAKPGNAYPASLKLPGTELIALSDFLQDTFSKNHRVKPAFVIPPGIDGRLFDPVTVKKDMHLLAAGSLITLKRFDIFIEIVAELKKEIPGIQAVLIGEGPGRKKLEQLIRQLGLNSNITLTGELAYPQVLQWMQRSRVFIHPSAYEGFSGVCQEALAAGARVISFCKPMNTDISNWHIVSGKEQIKDLALQLLQNKDAAFAGYIPYSMNDTVKKLARLYNF